MRQQTGKNETAFAALDPPLVTSTSGKLYLVAWWTDENQPCFASSKGVPDAESVMLDRTCHRRGLVPDLSDGSDSVADRSIPGGKSVDGSRFRALLADARLAQLDDLERADVASKKEKPGFLRSRVSRVANLRLVAKPTCVPVGRFGMSQSIMKLPLSATRNSGR